MYRTLIDTTTVCEHLNDHNWVIVDCRFSLKNVMTGRQAYEMAHIPGAVYADLDQDLSSHEPVTDQGRHPLPSPEQMKSVFGRLGIDASKQVVLYDSFNHAFASRMWWMLRYMGHESVAVLNGGWQAWADADLPTSVGGEQNSPLIFEGETQAGWLVQIAEVSDQMRLIDSRSAERYRGEVEPLDAVAGHIPGAANYFYGQHLDQNGRFVPIDQIRANLAPLFEGAPAAEATFYCGSGVSACVNLLAATHAGLGNARLYVGSWSEWSRLNPDQIG